MSDLTIHEVMVATDWNGSYTSATVGSSPDGLSSNAPNITAYDITVVNPKAADMAGIDLSSIADQFAVAVYREEKRAPSLYLSNTIHKGSVLDYEFTDFAAEAPLVQTIDAFSTPVVGDSVTIRIEPYFIQQRLPNIRDIQITHTFGTTTLGTEIDSMVTKINDTVEDLYDFQLLTASNTANTDLVLTANTVPTDYAGWDTQTPAYFRVYLEYSYDASADTWESGWNQIHPNAKVTQSGGTPGVGTPNHYRNLWNSEGRGTLDHNNRVGYPTTPYNYLDSSSAGFDVLTINYSSNTVNNFGYQNTTPNTLTIFYDKDDAGAGNFKSFMTALLDEFKK